VPHLQQGFHNEQVGCAQMEGAAQDISQTSGGVQGQGRILQMSGEDM
jgi:hypothetical protein